jgi:hypothetical protein
LKFQDTQGNVLYPSVEKNNSVYYLTLKQDANLFIEGVGGNITVYKKENLNTETISYINQE